MHVKITRRLKSAFTSLASSRLVDPGDGIFAGVIVARFIGTRQPLGSYSIYSILLPNKIQFKPLTAKFTAWLACVAGAWNSKWAQEGTGARGRHARGEGSPARKAYESRFNSHSVSVDISNSLRGSLGKSNCAGQENCQSIVLGQRSEGLTLHHQLLKPINAIIEVQVSEVTSIWFNGTMWLYKSQRKVGVFKLY